MKFESNRTTVRLFFLLTILCSSLIIAPPATAGGYPWKDHAKPYDFRFGNDIDTHQQTQLKSNGELFGFLYVFFTGIVDENGVPKARHCQADTPAGICEVGWIIRGKPGRLIFVYHDGDHPIWLAETRNLIPLPGAYSHFHWLNGPAGGSGLVEDTEYGGYFLELQAVDEFIFIHHDDEILIRPGIDIASHVNIVGSFP